jgi:Arc/MetJ family transcription regulator
MSVYPVIMDRMVRTNVVIDERLLDKVMGLYGFRTKREAIDFALRRAAGEDLYSKLLEIEGIGWEGDLDAMRDRPVQEH